MPTEELEIINFKAVTKKFGEIIALENISFGVKRGEFIFLTGPSGAGKTTILKLILGEYISDGGEVVVDGVNVSNIKGF
jgi:ABC-type multidrug transport system ATPase subunit